MGNKQAKTKSSSSSAKTTIKTLVECKEPSTKVETLPPLKLDYMEQIPKSDTLNHALETLATKLLRYFYMSGGDAQSTIVSPISIAVALSMAAEGANTDTLAELRSVLEVTDKFDFADWSSVIKELKSDKAIQVVVANGMWTKKDAVVEADFQQTLKTRYGAEQKPLVSAEEINTWVAEKTKNLIPKILEELSPHAFMVLVNTLYFKAKWQYEFPPEFTGCHNFTNACGLVYECNMMNLSGVHLPCYEDDDLQCVDLPYRTSDPDDDQAWFMRVVLPAKHIRVESLISERLSVMSLDMTRRESRIFLPKFNISTDIMNLTNYFEDVGLKKAYNLDQADFTNISKETRLLISGIFHRVTMIVDEEGTEAAAATAVCMDNSEEDSNSDDPPPFIMRVDRPFFVALLSGKSKLPAFVGIIRDVSAYVPNDQ